jgi:hypothetical protein
MRIFAVDCIAQIAGKVDPSEVTATILPLMEGY